MESEEGQRQLTSLFMAEFADDIRWKLQKLRDEDAQNLGKMLNVAWTIYRNREQNKERTNAPLGAALEGKNRRDGREIVRRRRGI